MNTICLRTSSHNRKAVSALFAEKGLNFMAAESTDVTYVNGFNNENGVMARYLTRKEATELLVECNEKFGNGGNGEIINIAYEFGTVERTLLVTRHAAAKEWMLGKIGTEAELVQHLELTDVLCNDTVVGTLPINMVARIYERGASYIHLALDVPFEARGKELTVDDMERYGATLRRYVVRAA